MYTINIDKECGCFRRSDLENNMTFESNDDALIQATSMKNKMNDEFCGKHDFTMVEDGNTFQILMQAPAPTGGCCGGGHCS